jgi:hypothetical protein
MQKNCKENDFNSQYEPTVYENLFSYTVGSYWLLKSFSLA